MLAGERNMDFNANAAYKRLFATDPVPASDRDSWKSRVPFVYMYLFSSDDGTLIYAGETHGKTRGRRLYHHITRASRLTSFGKTYQIKLNLTPEETHREIR